jgi:transposase
MGQRDHAFSDAALLERELAVFRSQRHRKPAKQRSHYAPEERAEILQVIRLRGWSAKQAGQRFVVHPNTIRNWQTGRRGQASRGEDARQPALESAPRRRPLVDPRAATDLS